MSGFKQENTISLQSIELLPKEISIDSRYNVRPFTSNASGELEDQEIKELAAMIEAEGQLDPVIITPDHVLVMGHRRRRAVILINDRRSVRGQPLLRLRCNIDSSKGDLRRKGIISNLHRKSMSPMDIAWLIPQIRKDNNWEGRPDSSSRVAEYLGISKSLVYRYEKIMCCEKELQNRIHDGSISMQSAIKLITKLPNSSTRAEVIKRAEEIKLEDHTDKTVEAFMNGKKSHEAATEALINPPTRIELPAINQAIREHHKKHTKSAKKLAKVSTGGRPHSAALPLNRSEILQAIGALDTPDCPAKMQAFLRYLAGPFAKGRGSLEQLQTFFRRAIGRPRHKHSGALRKPMQSEAAAAPKRRYSGAHGAM